MKRALTFFIAVLLGRLAVLQAAEPVTIDLAKRIWQGIPGIERSAKGRVFACWFTGGPKEPSPENTVLFSYSDDAGKTFVSPEAMALPLSDGTRCYDPCLWIDPKSRLWYLFNRSLKDSTQHGVYARICDHPDASPLVWGAEFRVGFDGPFSFRINKPIALSTGEWIMPVTHALESVAAWAGFDPKQVQGVGISTDEGKTWTLHGAVSTPGAALENMIVELRGGRLWMLIRTAKVLWESHSSDKGRTWTGGKPTTIATPHSRFFIRRLATGNLLLVNHYKFKGRSHLTAQLSTDDGATWNDGLLLDERGGDTYANGVPGGVSYPDGVQDRDGLIWITYDRGRNSVGEVLLAKFREEDVLAGKNVSGAVKLKQVINKLEQPAEHGAPTVHDPKSPKPASPPGLLLAPLAALRAETTSSPIPLARFTQIRVTSSALPIRTAAENLRDFLKAKGVDIPMVTAAGTNDPPAAGTILLGTTADTPLFAVWAKEGRLSVTGSDSAGDAYEVAVLDGVIAVNGANPRAVLYGVFELEDVLVEYGGVPADLARHAKPSMGLRLLHPRVQGGFHGYRKSDFEFLARCGGNVAHLTHDWMKEKTLFSYIPSTEFPKAEDEKTLEHNRTRLRQYLDWCRLYGLDGAMWLCEIPCQGGPWVPDRARQAFLDRFPAECLSDTGTYQGKLPCLAHPQVEREYRRMVRQFLTDFPGVSMFLVFTLDSSGEFCDPTTCPRHKGVSKLTQYNRLIALMAEEGRKVRPDFQVFSVGWSWKFRGDPDYFPQQAALPAGAGLTMPPDGEAWSFDRKTTDLLVKSRALTREKGQTFLGYDIFLWGDDTVFGQIKDSKLSPGLGITKLYDFPFGIAAKLRRWQSLGADGFFDQWGTMAEYVPCNGVALRDLVFHPEHNEPAKLDAWAQALAARRFGPAAAPQVLAAWKEIEVAQQLQSDHTYYWHHLRPAWSAPVLQCPITLEALQAAELTHNGRSSAEPSKPHGSHDYSLCRDDVSCAKALAPALREAAGHFGQALSHLKAALPLVRDDARSTLDHWSQFEPGAATRLTPRQALGEQIIAMRLQEQCQRRMSRFFEAWSLVKTLRPAGTPEHMAAMKTLEQLRIEDEEVSQPKH